MSDGPKTEMLDVSQLTGDVLQVTFVVTVPGVGEKRYPMRQASMRVGRSDQSDIVVKDASVSSRHCDLVKEGGSIYVRDLGSSNGTFMNDERIQETELRHGDVLRLGNAATIAVQIGSAPVAAPSGPVDNENAGSTMMISAGDLDAMRAGGGFPEPPPAPPPPRRPAPPPEPRMAPPPMAPPPMAPMPAHGGGGGGKKGLIIGLGVGLGVLVVGVVAVLVMMSSARRKEDLERIERMKTEVAAINETTPCTAVQDSVSAVAKLSQTVSPPNLPANWRTRRAAERFIDLQKDMSRQYARIVSNIEQLSTTSQVTVDRVKGDVEKIHDELLRAKAEEVSTLLDERSQLTQDFIGGWRKLARETDRRAELVEAIWLKNRTGAEVDEYGSFRFSQPAPKILGTCRSAHEAKSKEIEEKLEELGKLIAE